MLPPTNIFFFSWGLHLQHMEVPGLGVELETQLLAYTTATSPAYTAACSNAESLTQWMRPGMEPTSSWILVRFLTHWATIGTPVFISIALGNWHKKIFVWFMSENVLPIFFFRSFMVSYLMFKSLSHFKFILVHGVRVCSNFTDLHAAVQFSQHQVLKRLFLILYSCLLAED